MQQNSIFKAKTLNLTWKNGGIGLLFIFKILGLIKEEALTDEKLIQKANGWRVLVEKIKIKWA